MSRSKDILTRSQILSLLTFPFPSKVFKFDFKKQLKIQTFNEKLTFEWPSEQKQTNIYVYANECISVSGFLSKS